MQKIITFLWYNGQAEEAVNYYVSIFPDSKVVNIARLGDTGPGQKAERGRYSRRVFGRSSAGGLAAGGRGCGSQVGWRMRRR